jgi:hypothetical protein
MKEPAQAWEFNRTILILAIWTLIGAFFAIRSFKWSEK